MELEKLGIQLARREFDAKARSELLLNQYRSDLIAFAGDAKHILNALYDLELSVGAAVASASLGLNVPTILTGSQTLKMRGLFHPIMKRWQTDNLTPNDLDLNPASQCNVITGPNMSGKSSLIRAAAVAVWLTQCGLPASLEPDSELSLFEHICVRVGSSDDIQHDRSSFYVEMAGIAAVLERSPLGKLFIRYFSLLSNLFLSLDACMLGRARSFYRSRRWRGHLHSADPKLG